MAMRLISASDEPLDRDLDNERMGRFVQGDAAAFESLYLDHKKGVYNFCRRMLAGRADAGEAMQEIFLKVISSASSWQPRSRFKTWLYTVARNHCCDLLRRVRPQGAVQLEELLAAPEAPPGDPALRAIVTRAIDALPDEQREVFVMAAYLELTFSEIAEVTGAPLNTTKSRMRLAVKHLRATLLSAGVVPDGEGP